MERPPKLVVIDDDPSVCTMLATIASGAGFRVAVTSDPTAAVDLVNREAPDLVLCDVAMPGMDGHAVLKALQADPATAGYPVVFLTDQPEPSERVKAFKFGVVDYLTKPFTPEVLIETVEKVLAGRPWRAGIARQDGATAADALLEEAQQNTRSGILSVRSEKGDAQIVVSGGAVVEKTAGVAGGARKPGMTAEFQELDPSKESIVGPDEGQALAGDGLAGFADVPEALRRALVVDDDLGFSSFLVKLLTGHGFSVQVAFNGEEGLQMALARQPWIILTDVRMPGVDGFELCRRIRSHSLIRHTPVIFLSGWDDFKNRYKGLEAGADEYLPKATPVRELLMRIHLLLRRYADLGLRPGAGSRGLSGRLEVLGPPGLLQLCNAGQMTGVLTVWWGRRELLVRFRAGQIIGAAGEGRQGREALYELLSWTEGHFEFASSDPGEGERLGGESFEKILLEGCRLLDERRHSGQA